MKAECYEGAVALKHRENIREFDVVSLDVLADESCVPTTDIPGVFVAGDCRSKRIRQVSTAIADGSVAALAASRYIEML